jgi:hypothetical protein
MSRLTRALISAGIGAAIATAVVAVVTLVTGTSFTRALTEPGFWIVEATTAVFVGVAVYTEGVDRGEARPRRRASRVASHIGWTAGATLLIGVLLAIATHTPISELLTSRSFLIAAGIAVAVAGLEAAGERKQK